MNTYKDPKEYPLEAMLWWLAFSACVFLIIIGFIALGVWGFILAAITLIPFYLTLKWGSKNGW